MQGLLYDVYAYASIPQAALEEANRRLEDQADEQAAAFEVERRGLSGQLQQLSALIHNKESLIKQLQVRLLGNVNLNHCTLSGTCKV